MATHRPKPGGPQKERSGQDQRGCFPLQPAGKAFGTGCRFWPTPFASLPGSRSWAWPVEPCPPLLPETHAPFHPPKAFGAPGAQPAPGSLPRPVRRPSFGRHLHVHALRPGSVMLAAKGPGCEVPVSTAPSSCLWTVPSLADCSCCLGFALAADTWEDWGPSKCDRPPCGRGPRLPAKLGAAPWGEKWKWRRSKVL